MAGGEEAVYSPLHLGQESVSNRPALPTSHPSNRGPSSSPSPAVPMEAEDVARGGAVSGEGRGVRELGGGRCASGSNVG